MPDIEPPKRAHRRYQQTDERCAIAVDVHYVHAALPPLPDDLAERLGGAMDERPRSAATDVRIRATITGEFGEQTIEATEDEFMALARAVRRVLPRRPPPGPLDIQHERLGLAYPGRRR